MHPWVPVSPCSTGASCTPSFWRLTGAASVAQPPWQLSRLGSCCPPHMPPFPTLLHTISFNYTDPGYNHAILSAVKFCFASHPHVLLCCFHNSSYKGEKCANTNISPCLICIQACHALERAIAALESGLLPQPMHPAGASEEAMQEIEVSQSYSPVHASVRQPPGPLEQSHASAPCNHKCTHAMTFCALQGVAPQGLKHATLQLWCCCKSANACSGCVP